MVNQEIINYGLILQQLKDKIKIAQTRAILAVNNELLKTYWEIGDIIQKQENKVNWGSKVIDKLSADLKGEFPEMKGLSPRNLRYMRDFAVAYPDFPILQQPAAKLESAVNHLDIILQQAAAKLPWGHHQLILTKVKTSEERNFYIHKAVENGWSRSILEHHIGNKLYQAQGAGTNNFRNTLPIYQSDLANQIFKDPYNLDFILIGEKARERDLENALLTHITKFLLELGDGFAFMGRQKLLGVAGREYYIDLLFYHTKLRRHVVIELKIGEFEPEYVGKMNLYLGLADDQLKGEHDQPAIGLILCKTKNKVIAEYALRDTTKPIGIAEYKIAEMLPEDIKGELPSIEEIEASLDEKMSGGETPVANKLKKLLAKISDIKEEQVEVGKNDESVLKIIESFIVPLKKKIEDDLECELSPLFDQKKITLFFDSQEFKPDLEMPELLVQNSDFQHIIISVRFLGLKKMGLKAFNTFLDLYIYLGQYKYSISFERYAKKSFLEKLYHQGVSKEELDNISDLLKERLIDTIEEQMG